MNAMCRPVRHWSASTSLRRAIFPSALNLTDVLIVPLSSRQVLAASQTTRVLVWSSLLGGGIAIALTRAQSLLPLEECVKAWLGGLSGITDGIMVMVLAWGVGEMSRAVQVGAYVSHAIGESMPPSMLPPAAMLVSGFASVCTGSSWGAMVLLFPIVMPLAAVSRDGGVLPGGIAGDIVVNTIGAVISGSMFGDHISPISDTTVLSALSSQCSLAAHVRTQAPYALTTFAVSLVLCLATALAPVWVSVLSIPIGAAMLW